MNSLLIDQNKYGAMIPAGPVGLSSSGGRPSLDQMKRIASAGGYGLSPSTPDRLKNLQQIYQPSARSR